MPELRKSIALYDEGEVELWEQVESTVREEHDAPDAREGKIAAQVFACYIGINGPLQNNKCPLCGDWVESITRHLEASHDGDEINV